MAIIGIISTTLSAIFYTLKYSFIKDAKKFKVSRSQVNLWYRLASLPPIVVAVFVTNASLTDFGDGFSLWFPISLVVITVFGLLQVATYQKHEFSTVTSLKFVGIAFSTLLGVFFLGERLKADQMLGIGIVITSYILLYVSEWRKQGKLDASILQVLFYYVFYAFANIVTKKVITLSSAPSYTLYLTLGLSIIYFLFSLREKFKTNFSRALDASVYLLLTGVFSGLALLAISYGYEYLPAGVVVSILSLETFISLWLSRAKYKEEAVLPKLVASLIAFVGIAILVF